MITYQKARSEADLDEIQRLRFRVFCRERVLETEEYRPTELECDFLDRYSIHFIARHFDLIPVGTIRLVRTNPLGLPVEKQCRIKICNHEKVAEISKIAISKLALKISGANRREILMGLLREAYRESVNLGIKYWYATLSPTTFKRFQKYGVPFIGLEKAPEHSGRQAPYMVDLTDLKNAFPLSDTIPVTEQKGKPAQSSTPAHLKDRGYPLTH